MLVLVVDTGRSKFCTRKQYVPRFVCPPDGVAGGRLQYLIATWESQARGRTSKCVRMKQTQISTNVVDGRSSCPDLQRGSEPIGRGQ